MRKIGRLHYGEKARFLFESEKISEGHYLELLNLIRKKTS